MKYVVVMCLALVACGTKSKATSSACADLTKIESVSVTQDDTSVYWSMTLQDLPTDTGDAGFRFNQDGMPKNTLEYRYEVEADADADHYADYDILVTHYADGVDGDEVYGALSQYATVSFQALAGGAPVTDASQVSASTPGDSIVLQVKKDILIPAMTPDATSHFSTYHDNIFEFCQDARDYQGEAQ